MITPTALGPKTALLGSLAQTGGSGGSLSWELLLLVAIVAAVVLGIAWFLFGTSGSD